MIVNAELGKIAAFSPPVILDAGQHFKIHLYFITLNSYDTYIYAGLVTDLTNPDGTRIGNDPNCNDYLTYHSEPSSVCIDGKHWTAFYMGHNENDDAILLLARTPDYLPSVPISNQFNQIELATAIKKSDTINVTLNELTTEGKS